MGRGVVSLNLPRIVGIFRIFERSKTPRYRRVRPNDIEARIFVRNEFRVSSHPRAWQIFNNDSPCCSIRAKEIFSTLTQQRLEEPALEDADDTLDGQP